MDLRNSAGERELTLDVGDVTLDAYLSIPTNPQGLVLFAHGSGSNRHSPRNRFVAGEMHKARLGTLLVSLFSVEEEAHDLITGELRFNIPLLGARLTGMVDRLSKINETSKLLLGIFGASTGAAGALLAAADRPEKVRAVVSRGGRPDLAIHVLDRVEAPTLLIIGGNDFPVIEMNRRAFALIKSKKKLVIIPGATHLFEEPGTLEKAAMEARQWFVENLR